MIRLIALPGSLAVAVCCVVATGLVAPAPAVAQETVVVLPGGGEITDLKRHAVYRESETTVADPAALLASDEGFRGWDPALEEDAPPLWLKLTLRAPESARAGYRMLVKRRYFRQLEIYYPDPDGSGLVRYSNGVSDYQPGEISSLFYVYPLPVSPGQELDVLIRVESLQDSLSSLELVIQDEITFRNRNATNLWAFGLYFGAMIALVFYNLVLYLNLRTPGHRLYVTAMTLVLLFMGMDSGLLQSVLPDWLRDRELLLVVCLNSLMIAAMIRFFQVFAAAREYIPRFSHAFTAYACVLVVSGLISIFVPVTAAAVVGQISQTLVTLAVLMLLGGSLYAGIRGSSAAWIFLAAYCAFLMGGFVRSLMTVELLPRVPVTDYALYVGSVMEAMILALGLSYRVGQLRIQRNRAVREQHRAMQLANLDALTGAYNRRFFENYLGGMLNDDERRARRGALILLDIDRFKTTNDTHGHEAGDVVLREMTRRCMNELREGDVLCRLGGDEFAIVLHEVTDRDAKEVAERIHARIGGTPVAWEGHALEIGVSVGVLPELRPGMDTEEALRRVDEALYEAKRLGRDRVTVHRARPV